MLLSRFWYVILAIAVGVSLYIVFLAVGQFNRRSTFVMKDGLASDSQTVEWALKIDSRRRLDQLAFASLNPVVQKALVDSNAAKDNKIPPKSKTDATAALKSVLDQIGAEFKPDALFAVDRDGKVVAGIGYAPADNNDQFELGGYPAVFDALHGFSRDDTWVLGDKMYLVGARPVEVEAGSLPAGAIVGLKEFSRSYAEDVSKRTRTNLAFYAAGKRVASATGTDGFEESQLELVGTELPKLDSDKSYGDVGRSDVRMLRDDLGAMFARLPGDAWDLNAGFSVIRTKVTIASPMAFMSGADDKDKASVPWIVIIPVLLLALALGIGFTVFEHTLPLREMVTQSARLKVGQLDGLQVPRFRGAYRGIAQNVNGGIERIVEKGAHAPPRRSRVDPRAGARAACDERVRVPAARRRGRGPCRAAGHSTRRAVSPRSSSAPRCSASERAEGDAAVRDESADGAGRVPSWSVSCPAARGFASARACAVAGCSACPRPRPSAAPRAAGSREGGAPRRRRAPSASGPPSAAPASAADDRRRRSGRRRGDDGRQRAARGARGCDG